MPSILKDLTVDWVSVVDKAAVRDPLDTTKPRRLLLMKREGTTTDIQGGSMPTAAEELVEKLSKADDETITRFAELLGKAEEPGESKKNKPSPNQGDESTTAGGDAGEAKKAAKKARKKARKDELAKADLSAETRKALEKADRDVAKAEKAAEKAQADAATAAELAKAERDARVTREFIEKAEAFTSLPIDAKEFGPVLKSIVEKLDKDDAEALDTLLKAADEQIRQGELMKQMGRDGQPPRQSDAYTEALSKADEIRKSDSKLSKDQAVARVFAEHPDLQARYLAEMQA